MISLWKPTHLLVRTRTNLQQRKIDFYLHCQQKDPVPLLKGSTNIQCFYQDAIGTILMIHVKSLANKIAKMSCSANSDLASAFYKRRQEINQSLVIYQKYIKSFFILHIHNFENIDNILWYFNFWYWFFRCTLCLLITLDLNVEFSRLGRQGSLVQVIKVGMEQGLLCWDPLGGIIDEHLLQETQPCWLNLLHAVLQSQGLPVREGCLMN